MLRICSLALAITAGLTAGAGAQVIVGGQRSAVVIGGHRDAVIVGGQRSAVIVGGQQLIAPVRLYQPLVVQPVQVQAVQVQAVQVVQPAQVQLVTQPDCVTASAYSVGAVSAYSVGRQFIQQGYSTPLVVAGSRRFVIVR